MRTIEWVWLLLIAVGMTVLALAVTWEATDYDDPVPEPTVTYTSAPTEPDRVMVAPSRPVS